MTKWLHHFSPETWSSTAVWGSCLKKKVALGKRNGPTADSSVMPDWIGWFHCDDSSVVNLCKTAEKTFWGFKMAPWCALLSGVSLVCACRSSPSAGRDSRSSPRWPPHRTPALCLLLYCTQTNAPTIEMYFSLVWWSVQVLETIGPAGVKNC